MKKFSVLTLVTLSTWGAVGLQGCNPRSAQKAEEAGIIDVAKNLIINARKTSENIEHIPEIIRNILKNLNRLDDANLSKNLDEIKTTFLTRLTRLKKSADKQYFIDSLELKRFMEFVENIEGTVRVLSNIAKNPQKYFNQTGPVLDGHFWEAVISKDKKVLNAFTNTEVLNAFHFVEYRDRFLSDCKVFFRAIGINDFMNKEIPNLAEAVGREYFRRRGIINEAERNGWDIHTVLTEGKLSSQSLKDDREIYLEMIRRHPEKSRLEAADAFANDLTSFAKKFPELSNSFVVDRVR